MKFTVELNADGICGITIDVEATDRGEAERMAREKAKDLTGWEVLSLHEPPDAIAYACDLTADERAEFVQGMDK